MSDGLVRALRRLAAGRRATRAPLGAAPESGFDALLAQRVQALEQELADTRGRVNGLLFAVAGTAVTQVLLRVLG